MGRPKGRPPKAVKLAKKKGLLAETSASKYSLDELLDKAEELIDTYQYDLAQKFCHRALEMNPDDERALRISANLLLESGDLENARHCLGRAIAVKPDSGHAKYFSLAQLFSGSQSLELYQKGIELLSNQLAPAAGAAAEATNQEEAAKELSNAYCSVAELYMTDLCDTDGAEANTREAIERALEADKRNAEAWQTKARFLLIKEEFQESKECIQTSLSLWLPAYQAVIDNKVELAGAFDPVEVCPLLYTTRINTAKLLIELELLDEATQVLEGMLEEDDEVVDTWYLLGWLNRLRAIGPEKEEGYNGNARFYLAKAKKVHAKSPTEDLEMIQHIEEVLAEIGDEPDADKEEEEGGKEPEWEDIETTDEEEEEEEEKEMDQA